MTTKTLIRLFLLLLLLAPAGVYVFDHYENLRHVRAGNCRVMCTVHYAAELPRALCESACR
jgi:hypothetical protein